MSQRIEIERLITLINTWKRHVSNCKTKEDKVKASFYEDAIEDLEEIIYEE